MYWSDNVMHRTWLIRIITAEELAFVTTTVNHWHIVTYNAKCRQIAPHRAMVLGVCIASYSYIRITFDVSDLGIRYCINNDLRIKICHQCSRKGCSRPERCRNKLIKSKCKNSRKRCSHSSIIF